MKYYIIPKNEIAMEIESAVNAEDAMNTFALKADFDLNTYFIAMTEEEYEDYDRSRRFQIQIEEIYDFMKEKLANTYDVPEDRVEELAEEAKEMYLSGDYNYTEHDCMEAVVDKHDKEWEDEEEE